MQYIEICSDDITSLNDADLRELVGRLCKAELKKNSLPLSLLTYGGAQEAADGGLDVRIHDVPSLPAPDFIPKNNTGFQVKKPKMPPAECFKEMQKSNQPKEVLRTLANRNGAYIIVSGADSCSDGMLEKRIEKMRQAVQSLSNSADLTLDFYGSDRIASWVNQYPSVALWVREKIGKPLSGWKGFGKWTNIPANVDDNFLSDDHPCVHDRTERNAEAVTILDGIKLVREKLSQAGSVVRIIGLSGVGKTRFAQALFESKIGDDPLNSSIVIYADLGDELGPTANEMVRSWIAEGKHVYVILDNCQPDVHRNLQKEVSTQQAIISLLTIEYDISDDSPEETAVILIEPSSEKTISALVQKHKPELGQVNADRIAKFSGGNARVALALASQVKASDTLSKFTDAELFKRLFYQREQPSEQLLKHAEILSLVYSFNVSTAGPNNELAVLAEIGSVEKNELYESQAELLRRHICQRRGDWRAVLPHAIANRLAKRALENIPIGHINNVLLRPENIRLLKSCAHRLSYLHDSEYAQQMAELWFKHDSILGNLSEMTESAVDILKYVAPILPELTLHALEEATEADNAFASRDNPNFTIITDLLSQLAYEDIYFDQAFNILLKFAETEKKGENNNSIVDEMKGLFQRVLSGTYASPQKRQEIVRKLFCSDNERHREIANELLDAAMEIRFTSHNQFTFGARQRDYGWEPSTHDEQLGWYVDFIEIVETDLVSNDPQRKEFAHKFIANNFRSLFYVGCWDKCEALVEQYGRDGRWPEMWRSIKQTIYFDSREMHTSLVVQLKKLKKIAQPNDLLSRVRSYAFADSWDIHDGLYGDSQDCNESERLHFQRIESLGKKLALEPKKLQELGAELFEHSENGLASLGRGIALGAKDISEIFEQLIELSQSTNPKTTYPSIFNGFIQGAYTYDQILSQKLIKQIYQTPHLQQMTVSLVLANPVDGWGSDFLKRIAKEGSIDAVRFRNLANGRAHETISDTKLVEILSAVSNLKGGVFSNLEILSSRFHKGGKTKYIPSDDILSITRNTIAQILQCERNDHRNYLEYNLMRLAEEACVASAPRQEIDLILTNLLEGLHTQRLRKYNLKTFIPTLVKAYPSLLLDKIWNDVEYRRYLASSVFSPSFSRNVSPLNSLDPQLLLDWCENDQEKLFFIMKNATVFESEINNSDEIGEDEKRLIISSLHWALLERAQDKPNMIKELVKSALYAGRSWSGSLVPTLEKERDAFATLRDFPNEDVKIAVKKKLKDFQNYIDKVLEREERDHNEREQRFE